MTDHYDLGDDELAARLRHRCTYAELMAGLPIELVRHRDQPDVAIGGIDFQIDVCAVRGCAVRRARRATAVADDG